MPSRYTRTKVGINVDINPWRASRLVLIFGVILAVTGVVGWALRWQGAALDTIGPERMQQLSREANDRYEALAAQQETISQRRAAVGEFEHLYGADRAVWPQGKREEYSQAMAALRNAVSAYNLACSQYRALWADAWRDLPAPDDLPRTCVMQGE